MYIVQILHGRGFDQVNGRHIINNFCKCSLYFILYALIIWLQSQFFCFFSFQFDIFFHDFKHDIRNQMVIDTYWFLESTSSKIICQRDRLLVEALGSALAANM